MIRNSNRVAAAFLAVAAMLQGAAAQQSTAVPASAEQLEFRLKPLPGTAGVDRLVVTLRFGGIDTAAGAPLLRLPLIASNVDTVATVIADLTASDAAGPLTLTARDVDLPSQNARDAVAGGPSREWIANRAVKGTLTVQYSVPAEAALPPRGPAPPFGFSADGAGVSAAGHVFVLLPPGERDWRTTIDWDLSAMPAGTRGVSSLGEGRVSPSEPMSGQQLRMAFYMAGKLGTWPARVPATGFFSAWQGNPPFAAAPLMQWTGTLYGHYSKLFGQKEPPPYGVFLRYNPINAGGGVGLYHSFVTTFGRSGGAGSDGDEVKLTLAHEMFHTFQPFITQPGGLESSWFGEGLATFYQSALPLRFGMITPAQFLKSVNGTSARYYTSIMANVPNSEVPKRFWADTRVRTLPYDRGMLYFATVDAAVRKASGGKRSLDDLMLAMLALGNSGKTTTNADWEALLAREIGGQAVTAFRDTLEGRAIPLPGSDAFGPCFRRTTKKMRRYEVGFDPAVLAEPKRIVRGLVPGSAAALAGLRDGDEITVPVPQDGIQGNQTATLDLKIRRGAENLTIHYLPRGETVDAWQWERVPGVPDAKCAR